jgi:hypothetical protein
MGSLFEYLLLEGRALHSPVIAVDGLSRDLHPCSVTRLRHVLALLPAHTDGGGFSFADFQTLYAAHLTGRPPPPSAREGASAVAVGPGEATEESTAEESSSKVGASLQESARPVSAALSVNRKVGAGLAARMAALDSSKVMMMPLPQTAPMGARPWITAAGGAGTPAKMKAAAMTGRDADGEDGSFQNVTLTRPTLATDKPRRPKKVEKCVDSFLDVDDDAYGRGGTARSVGGRSEIYKINFVD